MITQENLSAMIFKTRSQSKRHGLAILEKGLQRWGSLYLHMFIKHCPTLMQWNKIPKMSLDSEQDWEICSKLRETGKTQLQEARQCVPFPQTWIKHLRFDLRFFKQNKPNSLIKWLFFHETLWMLFFFEGWTRHDLVLLLLFFLFRLKLGIGYKLLVLLVWFFKKVVLLWEGEPLFKTKPLWRLKERKTTQNPHY